MDSNKKMTYDLIIIGSGPAGLTASIYASRYNLNNLVFGKKIGGTIGLAYKVENYPGFRSIPGLDLMAKIEEHSKDLGGQIVYDPVQKITKRGEPASPMSNRGEQDFIVYTLSGQTYQAKTIIVATGTERRTLGINGENEYLGKGVSYCTTCDAPFYKDKIVALVGGSDGAISGAVHAAEYAKKVYVIYRKNQLRAEPAWINEWKNIEVSGKGEAIYNTNIIEIKGDGQKITQVVLDTDYKNQKELVVDGVFIEIGGVPGTSLAQEMGIEMNDEHFIKVDKWMDTNIPGVFAAGDCTDFIYGFAQMITACGMGALAARSAYVYLRKEMAPQQRGI